MGIRCKDGVVLVSKQRRRHGSGARVIIANLVPPGLASMTEEERDVHLDRLLDRIEEKLKDAPSSLCHIKPKKLF